MTVNKLGSSSSSSPPRSLSYSPTNSRRSSLLTLSSFATPLLTPASASPPCHNHGRWSWTPSQKSSSPVPELGNSRITVSPEIASPPAELIKFRSCSSPPAVPRQSEPSSTVPHDIPLGDCGKSPVLAPAPRRSVQSYGSLSAFSKRRFSGEPSPLAPSPSEPQSNHTSKVIPSVLNFAALDREVPEIVVRAARSAETASSVGSARGCNREDLARQAAEWRDKYQQVVGRRPANANQLRAFVVNRGGVLPYFAAREALQ